MMRKLLAWCVFALTLIVCPYVAHALTLDEARDHLKAISFPLYAKDADLGRQCVGWNAMSNKTGALVYYLSAGHCESSYYAMGDRGLFNWALSAKVNDDGKFEFLYSAKPSCDPKHERFPVLAERIDPTKRFFTLAQTSGTEEWASVGVVELKFLRDDPVRGFVFDLVCPKEGCKQLPSKGLSGSPIIDEDLRAVAIMKGTWPFEPTHPLGTELAPILPFLKSVASTNSLINRARFCAAPQQQSALKE